MRTEGQADAFAALLFPEGLIPQILNLLADTWQTFKKPTTRRMSQRSPIAS
jgi:hypothetical protein